MPFSPTRRAWSAGISPLITETGNVGIGTAAPPFAPVLARLRPHVRRVGRRRQLNGPIRSMMLRIAASPTSRSRNEATSDMESGKELVPGR